MTNVTVRMPKFLRDILTEKAKAAGLSLNTWMLQHLEAKLRKTQR